MRVLAFDIETVPDVESGRRLFDLEGLSDSDTARAMQHLRYLKTGSEFLALHLQRIVVISVVYADGNTVSVKSLGSAESSEAELLTRFFDGIERSRPTLVSWNGGGFDLPVIHYRSLLHGVSAPAYWETGDDDPSFRYNNYLNRFHSRHTDLMDVIAGYQPRASAPLDQIAQMLGFPGKLGMSGDKVWDAWQQGKIVEIRDYCETDALNTYLIFLRFELLRGVLDNASYQTRIAQLKSVLKEVNKPHFLEFLRTWDKHAAHVTQVID
jgi:predicted PolB exonuclease-like 3'-5' exonuclease